MTGLGTATMSVWHPPSGEAIANGGSHDSTGLVSHIATDHHGIVDVAGVHGRVVSADVAVTQQSGPALVQFVAVRILVIDQFPDVARPASHDGPPFHC